MDNDEPSSARVKQRRINSSVDNSFSSAEEDGSSDEKPASGESCTAHHTDGIANNHSAGVSLSNDAHVEGCNLENDAGNMSDHEPPSLVSDETDGKILPCAVKMEISPSTFSSLIDVFKDFDLDVPKDSRALLISIASDSHSESSTVDDSAILTQDDQPSPPSSHVSGVSSEGATTLERSALSSAATSPTARSLPGTSSSHRSDSLEDVNIATDDDQHPNLSEFMIKVASDINAVKETLQVHTSMLQNILKKVSGGVAEAATLPEGLKFPIKLVGQLEEMETHLLDPGVRIGLINVLSEIGGRNADECVRRIMKFIIDDTLATKLNISGRNNKKAFGSTNLYETVYRGVKKNTLTSDCTRKNVEDAVAKWLIVARDRSGNRLRRAAGGPQPAD